jgi:hypothetical protein
MPRYDFECPGCQSFIQIFQHDGDRVAAETIACETCPEPKMSLVGYDADSTEELWALQCRIAELKESVEALKGRALEFERWLDDDCEIDDTDERDFNTRH